MEHYDLEYGTHIAWFYSGNNYESGLVDLIKDGISKKEKILFIASKEHIDRFNEIIKDLEQKNEISTFPLKDHLIHSIRDIKELLKEKEGYIFRIINIMSNSDKLIYDERIPELASEIESIVKDNHIWICAFNINKLDVRSLLSFILPHQFLIINNKVFKNYLYLSPEEIMKENVEYALSIIERNLTERDSLWMSYKELSDLYKALFENTGTATIVIEDFVITSVNSAFERLTGFKREEIEGKKLWTEFIPYKEDLDRMLEYRELRLRASELAPKVYETRIKDKNGKIIDVMLNADIIPGTRKFIASLMDITELKRINRLLKMLSLGNQELVRTEDEKEIIDRILKIVKEYGEYRDVIFDQTIEGYPVLRVATDRNITEEERSILRELSQDIDYGIKTIRSKKLLKYNEERYRLIFENTPIALMEEDLTEAIEYLDSLKKSGVENLENYFDKHPEEKTKCIRMIKILNINNSTLKLYRANSRQELEENLSRIIPESEREKSFREILNFYIGLKEGEFRTVNYSLSGEEKHILLKWFSLPHLPEESERQYRIIVALVDITEEVMLSDMLRKNFENLKSTFDQTIELISYMVELRDPYTSGHQKKVAEIACKIAENIGLPKDRTEKIRIAGLLHDIGKIAIPSEILNKPTRLTPLEFEIIKTHPEIGHEILRKVDFLSDVAEIILQHHERLNGSGYPRGLKDQDILLEAKILALADVIEAMSSHRPYRPALSREEIIKELINNKGKLYDPDIVDAYLKLSE